MTEEQQNELCKQQRLKLLTFSVIKGTDRRAETG